MKTLEQLRKNVVDTKAACNAADAAWNAAHDAAYYAAYYAADAADAAADAAWDAWDKARLELNEYLKEQGNEWYTYVCVY